MKTFLFTAAILFCSCSAQRRLATGTYTISTVHGTMVSFKEIPGKYLLASDTLKVDDKVCINVVKLHH